MKKLTLALLILSLCVALLAACGGGGQEETVEPETTTAETEEAAAAETEEAASAEEEDPVLGFWFAKTASKDGETRDPNDVFGGTFYLYFSDEDECQMCIDEKRAPVSWERTETGITLTGDDTYEIVYPADNEDTMIITIHGIEVLLERYVEE